MVKAEAVQVATAKKAVSPLLSRFGPLSSLPSRFCGPFLQDPRQSRLSEVVGRGAYPRKPRSSQNETRSRAVAEPPRQSVFAADFHRLTESSAWSGRARQSCRKANNKDFGFSPSGWLLVVRTPETLLPLQTNISHPNMRPQCVLTFPVILQSLAEPAASLAVAIAIHIADASTRIDQPISLAPIGHADVADAQTQVLVPLNIFHGYVADFVMHIEIRLFGHFDFHVKLRIRARCRVKLDRGIAAVNVEIHMRVFDVAFVP